MLNCATFGLCALGCIFLAVQAAPNLSASLEYLDEVHDQEIYQAVVDSMNEWHRKKRLKELSSRRQKREESSVCYGELGCFDAGYLDMLPNTPDEIKTKFLLYPSHGKRRNGSQTVEVLFSNVSEAFDWAKHSFNSSLPTKVLIHGFGSDCSHIWIYEMRSALMGVDEVNVICVDWEKGAVLPNYVKATANTKLVGKQVAVLLRGLVNNNGLSLAKTHLIGFSLGAHVAGFTGAELGKLDRITGLDPAGPLFESQDPRQRLDQGDASFVDVIHSNGENLILGGLGSYQPMGHVDFYPNGGRMQKGCSNLFVGAVSDIIWSSAVEGRSLCNHRRAYKFFTDSVSPRCHFPAFPCKTYEDFLSGKCFPCSDQRSCGNMGYYADKSKGRGQLYLVTRDEEPFCAHQYHIKIETSPEEVPIVSYGKIQVTLIGDTYLNETFMMTRKEDEEMRLGDSISRILVPHPILSEPANIQILYTAYSGWLSSGLTQWRIDKITLSDSFGKVLSICKRNLILDSGVPVTLPLYLGECNITKKSKQPTERKDVLNTAESLNVSYPSSGSLDAKNIYKVDDSNALEPLVNNISNSIEIYNIPWTTTNRLTEDVEVAESSRSLNTRLVPREPSAFDPNNKNSNTEMIREIVEPILKPNSNRRKNARSQDLNKEKPEITEPILGPTSPRNNFISRFTLSPPIESISYNFYDNTPEDWADKSISTQRTSNHINGAVDSENKDELKADNPLEFLSLTVQFLPQRLARMFEQAERYARETILPLVSTYTPKILTEFISPRETKYMPLNAIANVAVSSDLHKNENSSISQLPTLTANNTNEERQLLRDDKQEKKNILHMNIERKVENDRKNAIYVDLPIVEVKKEKYIPLNFDSDKTSV